MKRESTSVGPALILYTVHLGVIALWSIAFFGLHALPLSLGVIAVLWLLIAVLTFWFYRIDRVAGFLLIPYLLWVSFASYLNASVVLLNPGA
jgi:tryptophan-rich sensory protein